MTLPFKNRIALSLSGLSVLWAMVFLICTGERNNPLDAHNPDYIPPSIIIDTAGANIGKGDTISIDSVKIMVTGNRTESVFRVRLDSATWSEWDSSGYIRFDSLAPGSHAVVIESKYDGWDYVVADTIHFFVRAKVLDTAKALTSFGFTSPTATGMIDEAAKTVAITVPYGTNVTALIASFATTGASVKVGSIVQSSDFTPNNFTTPVTYTVTAADNSTQDYVVTVTVSTNTAKALTSFNFISPTISGMVNESAKSVSVNVPHGTNVTALIATFATTGTTVKVGSTMQISGATPNNFTTPITYTVMAADSSAQNYVVTVTVSTDTAKALTSFSFTSPAVTGTINETAKTVAVTVPYGTNVTALVASFSSSGSPVKISGVSQVSGTTANNFTNPVAYTITAGDNSAQDYVVTVTVSPNTAKAFTSFGFTNPAVTGTINETAKTVVINVPNGTNVSALSATFATTGTSVKVGSTMQLSGATPNNFTTPLTYTVMSADSSAQNYVVTVTVSADSTKALTSFGFTTPAVTGTINEATKMVAVTVPYGTNLTSLVAAFTSNGSSVKIVGVSQVSGVTANNFINPVAYTITAGNNSTQDYVVTVTVSSNTAKSLTAFGFATPAATGIIDETAKTVAVTVPFGTNVTALAANFTSTGASVNVGSIAQISGATVNDFSLPVTYTIIAGDNNTQAYAVTVAVSPNTAKTLTSFSFATPTAVGSINESIKTVAVAVPYGTNVTALVASFSSSGSSVKISGVSQVSGTTANNFTNPVAYTVTAGDNSTQDYIVTVVVSPNNAKTLTSFSFATPAATGTINESAKAIAVTVPYGTNVTALAATFTSTGASVNVGSTAQMSGTTTNDFSSPVTYTVTAGDNSTQDYMVTVTVSPNTAKALTSFGITTPTVAGTINEAAKTVAVTVPYGTNLTSLIATFSSNGSSVKIVGVSQVSGVTANNFANPVAYTVTAGDNSAQDYIVTVTVSPNNSKTLTSFSFVTPAVTGTINEAAKTVAATVPYGTNLTSLVAIFSSSGSSVKISGVLQVSGVTANNFTNPVAYSVTAGDNSMQDYVVTVTVSSDTAKTLTSFGFATPAATGVINEAAKTVAVTVPYGTNVTALAATFSSTGASVNVGSIMQMSGTTANNFSSPVTYTVAAADASTQDYIVTVSVSPNTAKAITSFSFAAPTATGTINEAAKTVAVTVPYGTNVTALVATLAITGTTVKVGSTAQVSGTTPNNFTTPSTYTVTAADNSTQDYVVTVTIAANPAKVLTSFSFASPAATGTVDEAAKTVAVNVPYGTNVTALVSSFVSTGASVKVGATAQTSGTTANNFTAPLTYTVVAADASTQEYVVTVTVAPNPAKALTSFSFASPAATGTIDEAAKTVAISVPYGTTVTALVASFVSTGASVKVGTAVQTSGTTANNFTAPLTYTVVAADAGTQAYVVTVTVAANPAKALTSFSFASPAATGSINETAKTVAVNVPYGTNVTALIAIFVSTGASVKVGSTVQVSGTTPNNFSSPVTYIITAADASTQTYVVTVTVAANPAKVLTSFGFASPAATGTINEAAKTVAISVPHGTIVTALVVSFVSTGASVKVGSTVQVSGTTPNNFTTPVTYTVVAADASTQAYVVTVTILPYIYTVTFDGQGATVAPSPATKTVTNPATTVGTLPTPPQKTYYQFDGWYTGTNGTGTVFTATTIVTASLPVYAKWLLNAPVITSSPTSKTCPVNDSVALTVIATGAELSYRWQKNGTDIPGATLANYTLPALTADDATASSVYRCIVSNSTRSVTSGAATVAVSTLSDVDGNVYHQVKIGSQVWTMENLRVTKYNDGTTSIPRDTSAATWPETTPKYCYYRNTTDADSIKKFGALYNWYALNPMATLIIAPTGWHVAADAEWDTMQNYLIANGYNWDGTTTGNKISKSIASKTDWISSGTEGHTGNDLTKNNRSGFSALPGGYRISGGVFSSDPGSGGCWWSATEDGASTAWHRGLANVTAMLYRSNIGLGKSYGFSVRLVKD